jgi:hypothetical protein
MDEGYIFRYTYSAIGRLCGKVVRVPGHKFRGPGSIPGTTTFPEK